MELSPGVISQGKDGNVFTPFEAANAVRKERAAEYFRGWP
jgi:peroxiredoxin family protein